jgi:16S rRNA processing protein RimM
MTVPEPGDEWVVVAVFQRPHGLRGETRLRPLTRDPGQLLDPPVRRLQVRRGGALGEILTLRETRLHEGLVYATFDEINGRTEAERLTNAELVVRQSELWEPPEGAHYVFQLEGLEVRDADSGERLGVVVTAREGAAQDLLVLRLDSAPGKDLLLPIVDELVPEVSVPGGFVRVRIPEGLAEV